MDYLMVGQILGIQERKGSNQLVHLLYGVAAIQHVAVNCYVGVGVTTGNTSHAMAKFEDQIIEHTYCPKWYVSCMLALYAEKRRASHVLNCSGSMKHVIPVVPMLRLIRNAVEKGFLTIWYHIN